MINSVVSKFRCVIVTDAEDVCHVLDGRLSSFSRCILQHFEQPVHRYVEGHPGFWLYRVILLALDPRKCEYLKDYYLDFENAYMTTYLAS